MARYTWIAIALVACKHAPAPADDCKLVHDDPTHAMAELSTRYPQDPVKVAQTIERCVAPTGDECERIAAVLRAIPKLAPSLARGVPDDELASCRGMPAEMRRCMLPSYALAHADECAKVRERIASTRIDTIDVHAARPPACEPGSVAIYRARDGLWLATGSTPEDRCFAANKGGAADFAWLERQLRHYDNVACRPSIELVGHDAASYQELIDVMDVGAKLALPVGMTSADALPAGLAGASAAGASSECKPGMIPIVSPGGPEPPSGAGSATGGPDFSGLRKGGELPSRADLLKQAPVIVITTSEITIANPGPEQHVANVAEVVKGSGSIAALTKLLPPDRSDGTIVLQADQRTPVSVINRVVLTLSVAHYDNLVFAVKNK
jgi:hypothetical protein